MSTHVPRRLIALIVGLVLVAAACTSGLVADSTDPSAPPAPGTPGTAPPGPKIIKIGVIAPLDRGLTGFGAGIRNSAQLAVDEANATHMVAGYTIELEAVDDSSDPVVGEAAARKLAADPAVIGVVGPYNSGVAARTAPVLADAGIPLISPSNTDPALTLGNDLTKPVRPNRTYFRMVGTDIGQAKFLAHQAKDLLEATSVSVVSETKAVSKGLADNFAAEFTRAGGAVAVRQVVPDGADDFTDFINAARPTNPSLVFFGGEYPVAVKLRAQAIAAGFTVPILGGDGMKDDAYLAAARFTALGDLASSVGRPVMSLESALGFFADYVRAEFPLPPTDYGLYAYDAVNVIIEAAAQTLAGQTTFGPAIRRAVLDQIQGTDMLGASGHLAFDEFGDAREPVFTLYRVGDKDGWVSWQPLA